MTLLLFNIVPTSSNLNDNAANTAILAADMTNYIGRIDFLAMEDLGGYSESIVTTSTYGNLPIAFILEEGKDIYGVLVTRDAITGEVASMTMTITLSIIQL